MDVEQDDIGLALGDPGNRGLDVVRLADHLHSAAELRPDPRPEQGMIVDDEHAWPVAGRSGHAGGRGGGGVIGGGGGGGGGAGLAPTARGRVSLTSVPSPGTLRRLAAPPLRAILACTDSDSPLRSEGTIAGSNPRPRSRTKSETWVGSTSA